MLDHVKSVQLYDEALAFHSAKEFKKAFPLMLEAAALGHPSAMTVLGSMYLLGQGTKEDGKQAESWLQKSLDAGYSEAGSVLGMAYATGKAGVKINQSLARELLTKAAESGDAQSQKMLNMMEKGEGIFALKSPRGSKLH